MKFYVYNNDELTVAAHAVANKHPVRLLEGDEWFRLESGDFLIASWQTLNIQKVSNPKAVDYFVCPTAIFFTNGNVREDLLHTFCNYLPYWHRKNRHVFFEFSDSPASSKVLDQGNLFKRSCPRSRHLALHYEVNLDTSYVSPIRTAKYKCSFVGCLETHEIRHNIPFAISKIRGNTHLVSTPNFFSELSKETQNYMRNEWTNVINQSQFILCPRGHGLNSIRFFEAMAFGRIPVLLADNTKLPLDETIRYEEFVVFVPEKELLNTEEYIKKFEERNDLDKASAASKAAWDQYLTHDKMYDFLMSALPRVEPNRVIL